MNFRSLIGVACLMCAFVGNDARAYYLNGYSEWRELKPELRNLYVMGLFDGARLTGNADYEMAISEGLNDCALEMSLRASMLVEAVDDHYASDKANWDDPPNLAFHEQIIRGACIDHVNAARRNRGLSEWKSSRDNP